MRQVTDARAVQAASPAATLARLWIEVEGTRLAIGRSNRNPAASDLARAAYALLAALGGSDAVRTELADAAAAFAAGVEERPEAERWVYFAVAARATLDQAAKSGVTTLARELEVLDDVFEDVREAVLLLEPEDYKEALAGTPANTRVWWGERARLDEGLREIELERVLGAIAI